MAKMYEKIEVVISFRHRIRMGIDHFDRTLGLVYIFVSFLNSLFLITNLKKKNRIYYF